jgi:hypothetical protein
MVLRCTTLCKAINSFGNSSWSGNGKLERPFKSNGNLQLERIKRSSFRLSTPKYTKRDGMRKVASYTAKLSKVLPTIKPEDDAKSLDQVKVC